MATGSNKSSTQQVINMASFGLNIIQNVISASSSSSSSNNNKNNNSNNSSSGVPSVPNNNQQSSTTSWSTIGSSSTSASMGRSSTVNSFSSSSTAMSTTEKRDKIIEKTTEEIINDIVMGQLNSSSLKQKVAEVNKDANKIRNQIKNGDYKNEKELNELQNKLLELGALSQAYGQNISLAMQNEKKVEAYNKKFDSALDNNMSLNNYQDTMNSLEKSKSKEDKTSKTSNNDVLKAFANSNKELLSDMLEAMNNNVDNVKAYDNWKVNEISFTNTLAYTDEKTMVEGILNLNSSIQSYDDRYKTTSEELKKSNSRVEQLSNQIINKISENELNKVTTDVNSLVVLHDLRIENASGETRNKATINLAEGILNNQINSKGVLETVNALKEVNDSYKSKIDNGNYEGLLEKALCETFIDTNNITSTVYSENYVYIEKNEKKIEKLENKLTNVVNDGCKISDFNNYLELLNDDLKKTQNIIDDKENNIISLALAVNRNSKISGIKEAILDSKDEIKEYSKWKKAESKEYKEVKDNLAYDNVNNYINNNINEQNEYVNQFNNLKNENQKSSESNSLKEIVKDYYTSFIQEGILIGKSTTLYNNSESIKTLYNKQVEDIILNQQKIQTVGTIVTDNTVAVNTQETKVSYQDRIKELEEKNKQDQEKMSKITDSSARDGIQKQIDQRNSQIAGLKYQEYCEQYSGLIDNEQRKINNLENMLNPENYLPSSVRDERQKELGNSKDHLSELVAYQTPEVYAASMTLEDAKQKYESASKLLENSTGIPSSALEKLKNKQQQAAEEYNNATRNYNLTLAGTKYNNEKVNNIDLKNQLLNAQNMVTEGNGMTTDAVAYLKKQQEQKIADITKNISESNINLDKNRKEYNLLNNSFITDLADSSVTKKSDLENKIKELESQKSQITNVSAKNEIQKTIDAYKSQQSAEDKKIGAYYKLAEDLDDVTKLKSVLADKYNNSFDDKTEHRIYSNLYAAYLQDSIKNSREATLDYMSSPNYDRNTLELLENNWISLENEFNTNFDPLTITTTYGSLSQSLAHVPASERAAIQNEMNELEDKASMLGFDVKESYKNKVEMQKQQEEQARLLEEEANKNVLQKFFEGVGQGAKDFYNNWFQFGADLNKQNNEAFKNAKTYDDIIKIAREQTGATLINAAGAAWTGIEKAAEGVIDLGVMVGAGYISSQFAAVESLTGTYGSQNSLSSLYMDNALKFIGTDWVGNANKKLYQTDFGRYLDEKSYIKSDSAAAGFIEGLGEVAGTIMIGGAVANPKVGMTLVAGGKGYSRGVETALVDGADLQSANIYGLLSGGREASEWLLGMKANQYFEGIMRAEGATSATIAKAFAGSVAFDTVDAASEGFVQPLLQLSYKNNDGIFSNGIDLKKFAEQYAKNFEQNGGMATVIEQALIGGMMSSVFSGKDAIGASKRMDASTSAIGMKLTDEGHQITSRDYDVSVIKQNSDGTYRIDIENNPELATFANMGRKLKESNIPNVDPSKIVDVNYRPADNVKVSEGTVKPANTNVRNMDVPTGKAYDTLLNEKLDVQTANKISEIDNSIAEINKRLYTDDIDIPTELYLKKQLGELQLQKQNIEKGISDVSKYSTSINTDANAVAKAMDWDTMRFNREQSYVDGSKISIDANKTKINEAYFSDVDITKTTPKTFVQKVKDTGATVVDFVKNLPLMFVGKYAEADIVPGTEIYQKIKKEGLIHLTNEDAVASIIKDGQLNAKDTPWVFLHDHDRAYMFAGDPSYAGISANLNLTEIKTGVRIIPTDEQLSHLKYRYLNDNAIVHKGDFKFSPEQVEKVYYGLTRDINGNLWYAEINAEAAKNYHFNDYDKVSDLEKVKLNNEMLNKIRLGVYADTGAISTPDLVLRKLSDNINSKVSSLFEVNTSPVKDIKINTKINTPDNAQKLAEPRVYVSDKPISKIDTNAQTSTPKIKGTDYESVMKHNTEFENLADKMSDMTPEELLAYRESTIKPENKPIIAELDAALSKNSDQTLKGVVEMSINKMLESGSPDAKIAAKALINLCDNPEFKGFHLVDSSAFDTRTGIVGLDAELVDSANIYVAAHELIHGFQNFSSADGVVHLPDSYASIVANAKAHLESIGVASLFEDFGITFDKLREYTSSKYSDVMDQFEKQNLNILKEKVADSNITLDKYKQLKDGYKTILGDYYNDYSGDGMPKWKKVNTPSDLELTPDEFEYVMKQKESVVYKNSDVYDELVPDKYTYEFMKKNETTAKFILEDFESDMKNSRSSFDYINETMSNANLGTQDFAAVSEIITGVLGDPQKVKDLGADHLMGHSKEYYEARPTNAFEEASVEFARLKLFNRTDALKIIRFFVGDEYYNMLDTEYHRIINSDMKMTEPKIVSEVASPTVNLKSVDNAIKLLDGATAPLADDPELNRIQRKVLNGEKLTLTESVKHHARDVVDKNIDGYQLKSNHAYRVTTIEEINSLYKNGKLSTRVGDEYGDGVGNKGVDWYLGGASLRYGKNHLMAIIEAPADTRYFCFAEQNGTMLSKDLTVRHIKSSGWENPVPLDAISNILFYERRLGKIVDLPMLKNELDVQNGKLKALDNSSSDNVDVERQNIERTISCIKEDIEVLSEFQNRGNKLEEPSIYGLFDDFEKTINGDNVAGIKNNNEDLINQKFKERIKLKNNDQYAVYTEEVCRKELSKMRDWLSSGPGALFYDSLTGRDVSGLQLNDAQLKFYNDHISTPAFKNTGLAEIMKPDLASYMYIQNYCKNFEEVNRLYDEVLNTVGNGLDNGVNNIKLNNKFDIDFNPELNLNSTINFDNAVKQLGDYFGDFGYNVAPLIINADYDISKVYTGLENASMRKKFDDFLNNTKIGQFISKLTPDEIEAVVVYTSHEYYNINALLYEGKELSPKYQKLVDDLDSAIKKFGGTDADMTLYRGTTIDSFKGLNGEFEHLFENIKDKFDYRYAPGGVDQFYDDVYCALKNLEGKDIDNLGYTSTSPAYETSFASSGYDVVMEIRTPKGTEAAYINQLSNAYNAENEMLIGRGAKFHIDEVLEPALDAQGRKKVVVKCTITNNIDMNDVNKPNVDLSNQYKSDYSKPITPLSAEGIF